MQRSPWRAVEARQCGRHGRDAAAVLSWARAPERHQDTPVGAAATIPTERPLWACGLAAAQRSGWMAASACGVDT
eukprot:822152-Prymnesium_polylepis.1